MGRLERERMSASMSYLPEPSKPVDRVRCEIRRRTDSQRDSVAPRIAR